MAEVAVKDDLIMPDFLELWIVVELEAEIVKACSLAILNLEHSVYNPSKESDQVQLYFLDWFDILLISVLVSRLSDFFENGGLRCEFHWKACP